MDITANISPPPAGRLRFVTDGGRLRLVDPNGKRYRMRPEFGTPVNAAKASTTLTLSGRALAGETVEVGGITYTWSAAPTLPNEVKIGATTSAQDVLALVAAINASASTTLYGAGTVANPQFSAADGAGDTVVCTALVAGAAGNTPTVSTMNDSDWGGATATGGVDATLGSEGDQLYDGTNLYTAVTDALPWSESAWSFVAMTAVGS